MTTAGFWKRLKSLCAGRATRDGSAQRDALIAALKHPDVVAAVSQAAVMARRHGFNPDEGAPA